ncbi:TOBE domain-containing protein, partial [Candidatus Aerophobetes bacterium]|nr:TOBE domain-containing protein [Candidatus Aerophobetes bacterium]
LSLPDEIASKLKEKSCSRELKAGIRPTDIQISQSLEEKEKIPAQIYVIEPLGKHSIVTAKVNNTLFKIKVAGSLKIPEGENIWLKFNTHKLHFFDKKTGLNVMRG